MGEQSRLLRLPAELRLRIYEFVFAPSQDDQFSTTLLPLLTCRQIWHEARPLSLQAFSQTVFSFTHMYMFLARIRALQRDQVKSIRHVKLATNYREFGKQLMAVNEASDLHLSTLSMVIDGSKEANFRPYTVTRGLSVLTNVDKIHLVNDGYCENATLWTIDRILRLRDDGRVAGPQPKQFGQRMYVIHYSRLTQEGGFNPIMMTFEAVGNI
ncbi:hypothetical protein AOQ84DRAFT_372729 [Glonium stellatum]|uniref:Uncharacterized protein n=1 Tax=Glonium stellatum TaxID=574774 RepID=A0A8E2FAD0_9PEZI|nr:hypothetical protein AOQ84DRAFT_372729 [Glonium stellatum]